MVFYSPGDMRFAFFHLAFVGFIIDSLSKFIYRYHGMAPRTTSKLCANCQASYPTSDYSRYSTVCSTFPCLDGGETFARCDGCRNVYSRHSQEPRPPSWESDQPFQESQPGSQQSSVFNNLPGSVLIAVRSVIRLTLCFRLQGPTHSNYLGTVYR
jgi:hypothetical protein